MFGKTLLIAALLLSILAVASIASAGSEPAQTASAPAPDALGQITKPFGAEYIGAEKCGACHTAIYDTFRKSGHPYKLNQVVDGKAPTYPFTKVENPPKSYTWKDISYVIGGYGWKARFMDKQGYIITDWITSTEKISDTNFLNQYNHANPKNNKEAGWVKYNAGREKLKYDCGTCHTTGYQKEGSQDNLPGIVGTWEEPGVQCEACHGPGSLHAANPRGVALKVERDSELCGTCHRRDAVEEVNAKDGFIEHHEQYEELFQGKHVTINCVTCHDPHTGVIQLRQAERQTTRTLCVNCHFKQAKAQNSTVHPAMGIQCIDCHMPFIVKTATGDAKKFQGDIRTHLVSIDPEQIGQFIENGKSSLSQIGLDFACRQCHAEGGKASVKTDAELTAKATGYHTPKPAK